MNTRSLVRTFALLSALTPGTWAGDPAPQPKTAEVELEVHGSVITGTAPAAQAQPGEVRGWGKITDPDQDCHFLTDAKTLGIAVPGSTHPHDLSPEIETVNAPRVLQAVQGDFSVQVRVEGRFTPGTESTLAGRTGYNGAGLVFLTDPQNVVTLARAAIPQDGNEVSQYTNFEMRQNAKLQRFGLTDDHGLPNTGPVYLRLERHGQEVHGAVSLDGENWDELPAKALPAEWPKEGWIGVAAFSTSKEEFTPRFSELKVEK